MKKKWACTGCDYSSDKKNHNQLHLVTHSKVKPHKCDTCGKYFTQKSNLTTHIKSVHTKESKVVCEICDKVFSKRYSLLKHIKSVHDKIRSIVCTQCDKTFSENGDLTKHMRTHTKEKPYECLFCDKFFATTSIRSSHKIRIHTKNFLMFVIFVKDDFSTISN